MARGPGERLNKDISEVTPGFGKMAQREAARAKDRNKVSYLIT